MHLDAIDDAASHGAKQDSDSAQLESQEAYYRDHIIEVLTRSIKTAPRGSLVLPGVCYYNGGTNGKIVSQPIEDVIVDNVGGGKSLDALMDVLEESSCPFVADLRLALATQYAQDNAADLAQASI